MLPILISAKLWHQLRDIIWNDPSAMNRLDVRCAACKQHMTVGTDDRPIEESHAIRILPCGHMVGYCCLKDRFQYGKYSCPSCQVSLAHRRCGDPCYGMPMPSNPDEFSQIPSTIGEVGDILLSMDCTNCALKAFTEGLSDICNSLDVDKRPIPDHQFYAFSVVLDGESYSILPEGTVHLRPLEIPLNMREIVKEAKWQFLDQWKGMWRTWQVGEFEVRFDLYEDTKYDSTKAKVKRSVQKLQKALHRKP